MSADDDVCRMRGHVWRTAGLRPVGDKMVERRKCAQCGRTQERKVGDRGWREVSRER